MSRAKVPVTPEVLEQHVERIVRSRTSHFEKRYPQFSDEMVASAGEAAQLMRAFNHAFSVCNGLSVVARIIAGNDVVRDFHDPDDPDCAAPLSGSAINALNTMTAALLERLTEDINQTADEYGDRGAV